MSLQPTNGCKHGLKSSAKLGAWNDVSGRKKYVGLAKQQDPFDVSKSSKGTPWRRAPIRSDMLELLWG